MEKHLMKDQTLLISETKVASEGLARKFGDWWRDLGLAHQAGGQELHDFMAHPDSAKLAHQFINKVSAEYRPSRPLIELAPWMTVALGNYSSKDAFCKAIVDAGHQIEDYAKSVINNKAFTLVTAP